jgi:hypothetical protein
MHRTRANSGAAISRVATTDKQGATMIAPERSMPS